MKKDKNNITLKLKTGEIFYLNIKEKELFGRFLKNKEKNLPKVYVKSNIKEI